MIKRRPETRPKVVDYAVAILFIALVSRVVNVFLVAWGVSMPAIILGLFINALVALLLIKVHAGRNWARITYLVFFFWSLKGVDWMLILDIHERYSELSSTEIFYLVLFALQIWALYAIFTFPGSDWFLKPEKPLAEAAQGSSTASQ